MNDWYVNGYDLRNPSARAWLWRVLRDVLRMTFRRRP